MKKLIANTIALIPNTIALILCGSSIGWMIGMSTTPVIQGILTTIFSFVVIVLGVVSGIKVGEASTFFSSIKNVNLLPVGFFFLFLSFGAAIGVYTRTNDYLGVDLEKVQKKWLIPDSTFKNYKYKLFESYYLDSTVLKQKMGIGLVEGEATKPMKKSN